MSVSGTAKCVMRWAVRCASHKNTSFQSLYFLKISIHSSRSLGIACLLLQPPSNVINAKKSTKVDLYVSRALRMVMWRELTWRVRTRHGVRARVCSSHARIAHWVTLTLAIDTSPYDTLTQKSTLWRLLLASPIEGQKESRRVKKKESALSWTVLEYFVGGNNFNVTNVTKRLGETCYCTSFIYSLRSCWARTVCKVAD